MKRNLVPMPGIERLAELKASVGNQDPRIMKYVPKSKRQAINECWHDSDGYWITLKEGWQNGNWGGRTIHEDTIEYLRKEIAAIERAG